MSTEKLHDEQTTVFDVRAVALKQTIPLPVVVSVPRLEVTVVPVSRPLDPHQWSTRQKWTNVFLVASQATLSPICSTLVAVGSSQVNQEFHTTNPAISALPVALFVVGLGLGPLYLAPFSEMYGRKIIYVVSFGLFCLFNIGGALVRNEVGFIFLRFLAGLAGSAGPSLGGGTIGDMFAREERGGAQAVYGFGPTFGPAIGGLIGGYIAQRVGWRWLLWIMAISSGFTTIVSIIFLRETYLPYLIARSEGKTSAPRTISFRHSITRPLRMLLFAPAVTAMSLYAAVIYGISYLHLVTIPLLFGPTPQYGLFTYRWHNGNTGLAYLGAGTGCLLSIVTCMLVLNRSYRFLCQKYGEEKPEYRMVAMQFGMLIVPAGLLIYGWTAQAQLHFMLPLFGAGIFAFGMLMTYICIQTYLVDAFHQYAASALAGTIVLRSVFGALFTTFGTSLYKTLGYGWGTTVLALIATIALPMPLLFWRYGQQLRERPFVP
ncbi:major facilitator superfamily domain-containing protein [Cristinia sonorae]|uniref:Major facilitator superfamily domain-containing protein n=1 Tax=Cristinia sonorae TaxID=1940300 RepID=A0A8K0XST7_9AGAR|nr:major facilitator superfamily domain-containing protein [Cristinia sonorae]